jgi:hypothetical protein
MGRVDLIYVIVGVITALLGSSSAGSSAAKAGLGLMPILLIAAVVFGIYLWLTGRLSAVGRRLGLAALVGSTLYSLVSIGRVVVQLFELAPHASPGQLLFTMAWNLLVLTISVIALKPILGFK